MNGFTTLCAIDLHAESLHMGTLIVSILQPVMILALIAGLVLASAHLLTMIGTRWGDRRTSSKALFFSVGVHILLACGLIAMIPEYRARILNKLVELDQTPIRITTPPDAQDIDSPNSETGNTPIWDQIPKTDSTDWTRFNAAPALAAPDQALEQPVLPQEFTPEMALDQAQLPPEARPVPEQMLIAEQGELEEASIQMPVETIKREVRPEVEIPSTSIDRSNLPVVGTPDDPAIQRPNAGSVDTLMTQVSPDRQSKSLESFISPEANMQRATPAEDIVRRSGPAPAAPNLDLLGQNRTDESNPARSAAPVDPQLSRTRPRDSTPLEDSMSIGRYRPNATPTLPNPARTRGQSSISGRNLFSPAPPHQPELARNTNNFLTRDDASRVPSAYLLRSDEQRQLAVMKYGGSKESEEAVDLSLKWLASTQDPRGFWDASAHGSGQGGDDQEAAERRFAGRDSDTGVTALAILAFLGKQNTVDQGDYSAEVNKALRWLVAQQKSLEWKLFSPGSLDATDGFLGGNSESVAAMYCHGMATFALAEAYAMSKDNIEAQWLKPPLVKAINFIVETQLSDGGWRYIKGQPYGDMSMFGWQLMAIKSAEAAGITIPNESRQRLIKFLDDRRLGKQGGLSGYRHYQNTVRAEYNIIDPPSAAMTAEALFCRQMMGMSTDAAATQEAITYLLQNLPDRKTMNLYYWYYGTLAMHQNGGPAWDQWNASVRDLLVSEQRRSGPLAGSWDPRGEWGGYGGRIYSTAIATLNLEVYYRYLPLYRLNSQ